jgi:PAT family beta-lactamase induction signal transducer AmpG
LRWSARPTQLKFLWAPLVDALHVPFFTRAFGRRRGWLVFAQLLLIGAILLLALTDPHARRCSWHWERCWLRRCRRRRTSWSMPSASKACRERAGRRHGLLCRGLSDRHAVSTAGALFIVSGFEGSGITRSAAWMWGYVVMAAMVLIGTITALAAPSPHSRHAPSRRRVRIAPPPVCGMRQAAPSSEFLTRQDALAALAFVVLFKFTDAFSGTMTAPFVIDLGFTRNDYAAIVKGVGLAATLIGGFAGGFVARRYPLATSLWIGGVVQALANLSFSWLALVGVNQWALAFAITAENFTSAIGTVIFVAYLSALCQNPLHTATQYALLTALAAVGRTYLSSGAGYVAKATGWPLFFVICVLWRSRA